MRSEKEIRDRIEELRERVRRVEEAFQAGDVTLETMNRAIENRELQIRALQFALGER